MTTTPTITAQTTSWVVNTTTVNNSMTITQPAVSNPPLSPAKNTAKTNKNLKATRYVTITPDPVVSTKTINLTRTLKTWTRTAIVYTRTATASCTVPPRPQQPDPPCTRWPRLVKIPAGVHIARDAAPESYVSIKKRLADIRARRAVAIDQRDLVKRSADAPTVTVTGTVTANQTVSFPFLCTPWKQKLTRKTEYLHRRPNNRDKHHPKQFHHHKVSIPSLTTCLF
jgi:hypothetical protein